MECETEVQARWPLAESLSSGRRTTVCGSLNDIVCAQYRECEEVEKLLSQITFVFLSFTDNIQVRRECDGFNPQLHFLCFGVDWF